MGNPFKSEAEAFRLVVVVGAAGASVLALTKLTRPFVGAIWGLLLLLAGSVYVYRALRGRLPAQVARARAAGPQHRLLVVSSRAIRDGAVIHLIRERVGDRRAEIAILTRVGESADTRDAEEARQHTEISVQILREAGLNAHGVTGASPGSEEDLEVWARRELDADEVITV